jgi:hypothetical protein
MSYAPGEATLELSGDDHARDPVAVEHERVGGRASPVGTKS